MREGGDIEDKIREIETIRDRRLAYTLRIWDHIQNGGRGTAIRAVRNPPFWNGYSQNKQETEW
ncbi:hypothetical protein DLM86_09690 [Paenibacillus flagellatus]|uniref:Uncharacterized protein n=1 Tax=Paenibacillus flagellatus TaxID=2211139 RepID=A0A2V5KT35_9BACL|nr:hypothetical protein DLM86_09690 [Paenibacillus flagellatus]